MSYNQAILSSNVPVNWLRSRAIYNPFKNPYASASQQIHRNEICISSLDNNLRLVRPLSIPWKLEEGYYVADYKIESFVIASCEETREALGKDLRSQLVYAWNYYALETDNKLTDEAKKVKQWLLDNVIEAHL